MAIRIASLTLEVSEEVVITWDAQKPVNLWILSAIEEDTQATNGNLPARPRFAFKMPSFFKGAGGEEDGMVAGRRVLRSLGLIKERYFTWKVDIPIGIPIIVACAGKGTQGVVQLSDQYKVQDSSRHICPAIRLSSADAHLVNFPDLSEALFGGSFCDLFVGNFRPNGMLLGLKRPRTATIAAAEAVAAKRRIEREAKIWSTFNHINVLPFYGLLEVSSDTFLVSPWMASGQLDKFIAARTKYFTYSEDKRRAVENRVAYEKFNEYSVVAGIASGLQYLHSKKITHGDLKAANALLDKEVNPVLCDFGLTKITDGIVLTSLGLKGAGTMGWMSPEILDGGSKTFDSDIYAFGMMIGEIVTGSTPYGDLDQHLVTRAARAGDPPFASHPTHFDDLWQVLQCCLAQIPDHRPDAGTICQLFDGPRIVKERLAATCRPVQQPNGVTTTGI